MGGARAVHSFVDQDGPDSTETIDVQKARLLPIISMIILDEIVQQVAPHCMYFREGACALDDGS